MVMTHAETSPGKISPKICFRLERLGAEMQPLLIVDNVLAEPDAMVEAALKAEFYVPPHTHYPGLNARLPESYYLSVIATIRQPLATAFGLSTGSYLDYFGFFGLATRPAADATPAQTVPHVDCYDPNRLAMVHYFCGDGFGGTGFFRQQATGFESVDQPRARRYVVGVMGERTQSEAAEPAFPGEATKHYELIGKTEAIFNRLIVYRSHVLHAPLLGSGGASADPRLGRLTANGFLTPAAA